MFLRVRYTSTVNTQEILVPDNATGPFLNHSQDYGEETGPLLNHSQDYGEDDKDDDHDDDDDEMMMMVMMMIVM